VGITGTPQKTDVAIPANKLYLVKSGNGWVRDGKKIIQLKKNTVYLFPLKKAYTWGTDACLEKFFIHFTYQLGGLFDVFELFKEVGYSRPLSPGVFEKISSVAHADLKSALTLNSVLIPIIISFLGPRQQLFSEKLQVLQKYSDVMQFIKQNLRADLTVGKISRFARTQEGYFSRLFKKDTGMSLKGFISAKLLEKAEHLIIHTDKKIKHIADELGFSDEYHFSHFFKTKNGTAPLIFRGNYRAVFKPQI